MTAAAIDQLARLLHEAALDYDRRHALGHCITPWEKIGERRQALYRHVARAVLQKLGR